jgi:tetratricopeptide (TPR) repeat protein
MPKSDPRNRSTRKATPAPGKAGTRNPRVWDQAAAGKWLGLLCLLLFCSVLAAFWPAIQSGFLTLDDGGYVTQNGHVREGLSFQGLVWAFSTASQSNWHPLTWLSHMLDCQLFGLRAWGHHLTNVLLHAANALLLFVILARMTGAAGRSFMVATLFALHPLRVESVAWVAERKDVLSMFFFLLTLGAYWKYVKQVQARFPRTEERVAAAETRRAQERLNASQGNRVIAGWPEYLLALLLFALGLMSKPILVTVPFVLLLLDYWPLRRLAGPNTFPAGLGRLLLEKIPFLALATVSSVVTFLVQEQGGAVQSFVRLTLSGRIENALVAYVRYLGKTLWPTRLAVFYPMPDSWPLVLVVLAALLLVGVTAFALILWKRIPYLPVGWGWFLGTSVPVIGLVQVGWQSMADRYSYLPSIGLLILLVWGISDLAQQWRPVRYFRNMGAPAVVVALFVLTFRQAAYWHDNEALFAHAVAVTDGNFLAYDWLGTTLCAQHRVEEAIPKLERATGLKPNYATAHNDLGYALLLQGRVERAIPELRRALELNPRFAEAHKNLAAALQRHGSLDEALAQFDAYLAIRTNDVDARNAVSAYLLGQGRLDDAIVRLDEALRLKPDDSTAHCNLGIALAGKGKHEEAIRHFERAISLEPANVEAHYNLGIALAREGRTPQAIEHFRQVLHLQPDNAVARQWLQKLGPPPKP